MKVGARPVRRTAALASVLVSMALLAAPAAQANFKWSSGIPFSGEVESAPACLGASSVTIAWGDGNATSQGAFDFNAAVTGDHTFASQGTFAGTVTFGDGPCAGRQDRFTATVGPPPKFTQCPPVRLDSGCALLINVTGAGATILLDSTQGPYEADEDALIGVQNNSSGPISSIPLSVPGAGGHRIDVFGFDQDGLCDPGGPPVPSGCVSPPGTSPCGPELQSCSFPRPAGEPAGYVEPGVLTSNTQNGYEGPTSWFSNVSADASSGVVNFAPAIPPGGSTYFSLELPPSHALVAGAAPITVSLDLSSAPAVSALGASFRGLVTPNGLATTAYFQYGLDARYTKPGTAGPVYDHRTPGRSVGGDFSPHLVTASVSNLVPNAIYHARLVATNRKGTVYGPDVQFKTEALPRPAAPVLGKSVNIAPVSGLVLIRVQGQVVPLTQRRQVPANTEVDALQGTLKVIAAKAPTPGHGTRHAQTDRRHRGTTQRGTFGGAIFRLSQTAGGPASGLVGLTLVEGVFTDAPTFATCKTASPSKTLETLQANARGAFTTRGHYGSVTATNASWTITDRCDGTLSRDADGSVLIRDLSRPKLVVLHPGQSYLAKPHATSARKKHHH
ncbi:MAG TPA: hypothetical protein VFI54_19725 [Solirubrobacteraceae bacterium]|nr:hypothetical protein [Solirubrobacteraceae bacterium]